MTDTEDKALSLAKENLSRMHRLLELGYRVRWNLKTGRHELVVNSHADNVLEKLSVGRAQ
jgi:hypothetical protein